MPEDAPQSKPEAKSQKRSSSLEAGAFVATLLSALNHGPAQALEIDPHTSWIAGVEDNLYPSVMEEEIEHATMFVQYAGGSSEWVPPTVGIWNRVVPPRRADAGKAKEQGRNREIARMCQIHDHPLTSAKRAFKLKDGKPHAPPSPQDTIFSNYSKQEYWRGGVAGAEVIHAVFDPRGVWYYRPATLSDYIDSEDVSFHKEVARAQNSPGSSDTKILEKEINARAMMTQQIMENFVYATASAVTIPQSKYKEVERAYLKGWNAKIRFVPYEKIIDEPACAGPDYDPKTGVMARGRQTLN